MPNHTLAGSTGTRFAAASNPARITPVTASSSALSIAVIGLTKRFGPLSALEEVTLSIPAGAFHALLGETGSGKSALARCIAGCDPPDAGVILVNNRERTLTQPRVAAALGIGIVHQHCTLAPALTVLENFVAARAEPAIVLDWPREQARLQAFMQEMPAAIALDVPVASLSACDRCKAEIYRQLYLERRFLLLDEPTAALPPSEADKIFGLLRELTRSGRLTVLLLTQRHHDVLAYTDVVTVLRRGRIVGAGLVSELTPTVMTALMAGAPAIRAAKTARTGGAGRPRLETVSLQVLGANGVPAVKGVSLRVRAGEILGVAGSAGQGQRELLEALTGQRKPQSGAVYLHGELYGGSRAELIRHRVCCLPEVPLRDACVGRMSVAENLVLRTFERAPFAVAGSWLRPTRIYRAARRALAVNHPASLNTPLENLSHTAVWRVVLARELNDEVQVLIAANPMAGLNRAGVLDLYDRLIALRNRGAAVLLASEDLDDVLALADRIAVMFDGQLVYETPIAVADREILAGYMAGS